MYSFECSKTVTGDVSAMWAVWADPDRYPEWDPRELRTRLSGPFAPGGTIDSKQKGNPGGTATITLVEPEHRWRAESPLPGGKLVIDHELTPAGPGQVRVAKRYEVTGPLRLLFRLYYGPRVSAALPASFDALAAEAARRG
jgi:uncharacterized protein YndB with AHSA1/START domain